MGMEESYATPGICFSAVFFIFAKLKVTHWGSEFRMVLQCSQMNQIWSHDFFSVKSGLDLLGAPSEFA
jgi:hypothetical protein